MVIEDTETVEDLGRKGFRLIQRKKGFRYGEDTVLLAHFAALEAGRKKRLLRAAELGTNCGAASILLAARREDIAIDGLEVQDEASRVFGKNIALNGLEGRLRSFCMDIRDLAACAGTEIRRSSYDLVFFNPPYQMPGRGPATRSGADSRDLLEARFEVNGTMEDFFRAADWLLCPQGKAVLVQRASRLSEVLFRMRENHLEPKHLRFVHPRVGRAATLFLLSGVKNARPGGLEVRAPLILHEEGNAYTPEVISIYDDEEK